MLVLRFWSHGPVAGGICKVLALAICKCQLWGTALRLFGRPPMRLLHLIGGCTFANLWYLPIAAASLNKSVSSSAPSSGVLLCLLITIFEQSASYCRVRKMPTAASEREDG